MKTDLKIRFWDILLTSISSLFFTIKIYYFLYDKIGWSSFKDFYVGISVYNNHNKYLDIYIFFIYLILFFAIFPFVYNLSDKLYKQNKEKSFEFKLPEKIKTIFSKFQKLQYFFVLGFLFLHPFSGNIYPKLVFLTIILIGISLFDIQRRNKNNKGYSPFAICGLFFIFGFTAYQTGTAPIDDHHFGEKFAAFFMHDNFNLEYYKDIMLVHGRIDVASAWLGKFFFNENNIYGYCLGEALNRNIIFIITMITALFIFGNNILYTIPLLLLKVPSASVLMVSIYIALIKENIINKPLFWFWFYIIFSILISSYWTTIGLFITIAALPVFIYICGKLPNKKLNFWIASIFIFFLSVIFRNSFFEYLTQAKYYIEGSLAAFGNDFITLDNKTYFQTAFEWLYKMSALFFTPVLILEAIKQIRIKTTDLNTIFFISFSLLFVIISLPYTMGRLDNGHFLRLEFVSFPFLCIIIPYWLYKYADKNIKTIVEKLFFALLCCFLLFSIFNKLPEKISKLNKNYYESNTKLFNTGNIELNKNEEKRLTKIKDFLYQNDDSETFLDLTNRGMHYLYFNKKIPVQYSSFYNSIASMQAAETIERFRKKSPDNILVYSNNILHDNIFPSLRINALYRWIFLNQKYEYKKAGENVFLVKTNKEQHYTLDELKDLDYYFGAQNLNFLPQVWAASVKTLPLVRIMSDFSIEMYGNEIKIKFLTPQKVKNFDLLYIDTGKKNLLTNFTISINNSSSKIRCKTKTGKILVPMDNFPSWLLNDNLTEIIIQTDIFIQSADISFYNRSINHYL